jgi:GH24 family phage-related lysozyme (muramidase)
LLVGSLNGTCEFSLSLGVSHPGTGRRIAGSVVGMTKERMTKEQREQERERQQRERIDAWVQQVVAEAPPLTQQQRAKLAVLLEPVRIGSNN